MPTRCVEVGVGTGVVALGMQALGHEVVGVDISQDMLCRARKRIGDMVMRVDGARLPLADTSADGAFCVWVLHLVADRRTFLDEIARVIAPGGWFAAILGTTVAYDEIEAILRPMWDVLRDDAPIATDVHAHPAFELIHDGFTAPQPFEQSPADTADMIATRTWSQLWDVDDTTWRAVVEPTITALRSLPDPEQPLRRDPRNQLVVLRRRPTA
jgi:SAM-dependent methyltransferase